MNTTIEFLLISSLVFLTWMIGIVLGASYIETKTKERAIQSEKAYYHPQSGKITWSDNVTKFIVTGE